MKRDNNNRPGVSKPAQAAPIGDPRSQSTVQPKRESAATVTTYSVTLSARYIDSRLKQFYCR